MKIYDYKTRPVCKAGMTLDAILTLLIVVLCTLGINYIYDKHEENNYNYYLNNGYFLGIIDDSSILNFSCNQLESSKDIIKEVTQKLIKV